MPWFNGNMLVQRRKEEKLTQNDIANITGLSRNQIIAMEKGLFSGGIKYLYKYLEVLALEITITTKPNSKPQLHELANIFSEDDE